MLLPRHMRPHVAALYAFARTADDFADEGVLSARERLRLLDGWHRRLTHAAASAEAGPPPSDGEPADTVAIFCALGVSIRELLLPVGLFEDLLSAFRQDVSVTRYGSWHDLSDYCRRSANPVGRLVLRIAGHEDGRLDEWSDNICTALQLTNFWQDLKNDFVRGRIYLPEEEQRRHGAREQDLRGNELTAPWHQALAAAAERTRALFERGRPLCYAVRGRLRYELRATWLGGTRILHRLERAGFDGARPALGVGDGLVIALRTVAWRRSR